MAGLAMDASDELGQPWCSSCFDKEGVYRPAMSFCNDLIEFYCEGCFVSRAPTHDNIVKISQWPVHQEKKPAVQRVCSQHEREDKVQYCRDHCILICAGCSDQQHKECQVISIQEACTSSNIATDRQTFSSDVEILLEYVKNSNKSLQMNINNLAKETHNAIIEAKSIRDKLIQQINESYEEFRNKISKLHTEQKRILYNCQSTIEHTMIDLKEISNNLKKLSNESHLDSKLFLELQTYSASFLQYEDKIASLHLSHISLNYDFNLATRWLSESGSMLGDVSVRTSEFRSDTQLPLIHYTFRREGENGQGASGSSSTGGPVCPGILTRLGETPVNISGDRYTCHITGLDVTVDGHLIVSDLSNRKMKLFCLDGELLSSLKLSGEPRDVAVVDRSTAAVCIPYKSKIAILDLGRRGKLSKRKSIRLDRLAWGISVYNNQLILACLHSVLMINMQDWILWSTDSLPQQLFSCARYLTVRSGSGPDTVLVSDWKKQTITVLEADTGNLVKVCDVEGREPRGLTVDDNGNVFVCYWSGEISVWSGNMEERSLTIHGGLKFTPNAIVYSRRRQQLIVANKHGDNCIYNYKKSSGI